MDIKATGALIARRRKQLALSQAEQEQAAAGDYLAVLLSDREGEWCMSFWQRDEEYPERLRIIGGRSRIEPGAWGLMEWNFGTREQPSGIPLSLYDINGTYISRDLK